MKIKLDKFDIIILGAVIAVLLTITITMYLCYKEYCKATDKIFDAYVQSTRGEDK